MKKQSPALVLTGRHQNKRHRVDVHGVRTWLPHGQFAELCGLAAARITPGALPLELPKATLSRLRRTLARAAKRAGVNDDLIVTVGKKKFVLIPGDIVRDETFRDLLQSDCVARYVVERLLEAAKLVETA